jgi:hypothetical protein
MEPTSPLHPLNTPAAPSTIATPTPQTPPTGGLEAEQVIAQAKQLVLQYKQDPFRLNAELERLKGAYLQSQYHITPNAAEH